jgi:hypothetical protein
MLAFLIRRILQTVPIPLREMLGDGDDGMCMPAACPPASWRGLRFTATQYRTR